MRKGKVFYIIKVIPRFIKVLYKPWRSILLSLLLGFFIYLCPYKPAEAVILPSHYGSEVGIAVESKVDIKKPYLKDTQVHLDITSTKLIREHLYITTLAILGRESTHVGASGFIKVNSFLFLGGRVSTNNELEVKHYVSILTHLKTKNWIVEPYTTINTNKRVFHEGGVRFYFKDHVSLTLGFQKIKPVTLAVKLSFPIHDFKMLDTLFDKVSP